MGPGSRNGFASLVLRIWLFCLGWVAGSSALALAATAPEPLHIAAFNIQVFGQSKMKKAPAVATLLRILDRYDLVFIMEIRDSDDTAIYHLLEQLNRQSAKNYQIVVSERLGRTISKEQYAYLYNSERVVPEQSYVWNDSQDVFEREPYVAQFRAGSESFSMIGIHTTPEAVAAELQALPAVYSEVRQKFGSRSIFIAGDFNADCSYYNPRHGFDFFPDAVTALVPEEADTTVAGTSCTYDRVLAFGDLARSSSGAQPFNFQTAYHLSLEDAQLISDHYPVEWTLDVTTPGSSGAEDDGKIPDQSTPPHPVPSACGRDPYRTPGGYCYGTFDTGRRRVANACCPE